jgi:hypothetical protein
MLPAAMLNRWGKMSALLLVAVAIFVAGCGSSSSSSSNNSAERAKLAGEVAAQLKSSTVPADLAACVSTQAQGLPIDELRSVAKSSANPGPATKKIAIGLVTTCIKQGKGISTLHQLIVQSIKSSASSTLPPAFTTCIIGKANQTTPAQLSALIADYANGNTATAQSQARQVGAGLAQQCLGDPSVVTALRSVFIAPIKKAFATSGYSAAFKNCVLKKAEQFPAAKLKQAALNPAGANALGEAFGRNAAKACIASGAKP